VDVAAPDADKKAETPVDPTGEQTPVRDVLNDPLPNALKKETKERITTLIGMVKDHTSKLETVTRERDEIVDFITQTRATPEQYGQALDYLRLVNSPNRADREQALVVMQNEVAALARMLGRPVPGVNLLEGHNDLINEVSTGHLSPERAQEIAASRARAQYELRAGQVARTVERQEISRHSETQRAIGELNALEAQLKVAEPAVYAAKRKALVNALKPVFAQIPPAQWAATFKRAYDELPAPAVLPAPIPTAQSTPLRGASAGGGGNQPLRAGNPAGAAQPAPSNMLEAINAGIAAARR
jgi:hypothetical protein